jgi:hypothetical protein
MDWHRLFGLLLTDFFTGSPFVVELEKDLSVKQQFLDVVILRKRKGRLTQRLPDGLDNLADYNLVTFKSFQETLDDWALKELTGHYVNYRKQLAEEEQPLLPESAFRLYAVCSRFPHNLAQEVPWEMLQAGVYECRRGTDRIRVVVANQLPRTENNALLHLFSASTEQWGYGTQHYRQRSVETSTFIDQLFEGYRREGINMPYTIEQYRRDYAKQHLKDLTPEERLEGLTPEELLAGLSPEQLERLLETLRAEPKRGQPKKRRRK